MLKILNKTFVFLMKKTIIIICLKLAVSKLIIIKIQARTLDKI